MTHIDPIGDWNSSLTHDLKPWITYKFSFCNKKTFFCCLGKTVESKAFISNTWTKIVLAHTYYLFAHFYFFQLALWNNLKLYLAKQQKSCHGELLYQLPEDHNSKRRDKEARNGVSSLSSFKAMIINFYFGQGKGVAERTRLLFEAIWLDNRGLIVEEVSMEPFVTCKWCI